MPTAAASDGDAPARSPSLVTSRFLALGAAGIAFFVAGGVVLPVASRYATDVLLVDEAGVGIAIGSFSIAALLLRPAVGWATDRFGRRPLLILGAVLNVVSLALHLVAFTLPLFVLARSVLGAAEGLFLVAMISAGSDLAPPARRGEALSFLSLTLYLGVAIGPLIGETVLAAASYAWVWVAASAIAAVGVVLALLIPETVAETVEAGPGPRPSDGSATEPRAPGRGARLIHRAGLLPGTISFLGLIGMAAFFSFLPLYGTEAGLEGVAGPLLVYAVVVIALRIVGATWPDRFGAVRVSGAALAIGAAGLVVLGVAPTETGLLAGTAIFAAGVAFLVPALLSLAVSLVPPDERGRVVGTTSVFWDLSFGLGPVVLGLVATRAGYGATYLAAAALSVLGLALLVGRRRALAAPEPAQA